MGIAEHRSRDGSTIKQATVMTPRVHDKKCDITVPEVVMILSWNACVVITTIITEVFI